jgi:peptidoglycan/LPS O-acetylase OafA/YrhL
VTLTAPRTPTPVGGAGRVRDGYFDTLRAVALIRVVIYHIFGWAWLPVLFPSMGVMFALAGALMAASLDRAGGDHWRVVGRRMRRLLPPLWLMGVLLVPVMLWHGWTTTETEGAPLQWNTLLLWVLPISDPPGSAWAIDWVVPLWYIRAYLWFVLLSPAFLWLTRRWTKRVLALPLIAMVLISAGLLEDQGRTGDVLVSLSTFGACWLLGFACHDGRLREWSWRRVAPMGAALLAAGLAWAVTHQDPARGWDLDEIPLAQALYSVGAVLLLMRAHPDLSWLMRRPVLGKLVTVANSRAVTIYLWNNVAIFAATPLIGSWSVTAGWDAPGLRGDLLLFTVSWFGVAVAVLVLGWAEDLAARRRPRINPWPRTPVGLAVDAAESTPPSPELVDGGAASPATVVLPSRPPLPSDRTPVPARPRIKVGFRFAAAGVGVVLAAAAGLFWLRGSSLDQVADPGPDPMTSSRSSVPGAIAGSGAGPTSASVGAADTRRPVPTDRSVASIAPGKAGGSTALQGRGTTSTSTGGAATSSNSVTSSTSATATTQRSSPAAPITSATASAATTASGAPTTDPASATASPPASTAPTAG